MATRPLGPSSVRPASPVAAGLDEEMPTAGVARSRPRLTNEPPAGLVLPPANPRKRKIDEKSNPYVPRRLDAAVNHNFKVLVRPGDATPERGLEEVACRHFALQWARSEAGFERRQLTAEFSAPTLIQRRFEGKLDAMDAELHDVIARAPAEAKHLINGPQLGRYLSSMANALDAPAPGLRPSEADCLLFTCNHVFALHVEKKSRDGSTYVTAKLYDPNATASYKRVEADSPAALEPLGLADMLPRPKLANLYVIETGQALSLVAVCLRADLSPEMDRTRTMATAQDMRMALHCDVAQEIGSLIDTARIRADVTSLDLFTLLEAKTSDASVPGLYLALQEGHAGSVRAFVQAVLCAPELTEIQRFVLLEAADVDDGCSGLFMAMQEGRSDAVEAYARAVLGSELPDLQKVDLLSALSPAGETGLSVAKDLERSAVVDAFVDAVSQSGLPRELKAELGVPVQTLERV